MSNSLRSWTIHCATLAAAGLAVAALGGCEGLVESTEKTLQGSAAPLKETELPNTSKMLACCNNLMAKASTKGLVDSICTPMTPQVIKVIDTYQAAKANISGNAQLTAEAKTKARGELKTTSQTSLEPAARCLLTETIGKLGAFVLPADCEADLTIGALPQGKTCDDAKTAITSAK